jgi:hypothetical protein
MANIFTGQRPDLTPAQIVSAIPILAELLHSFGIYNLTQAQQDSLTHAATWAMALVAGDTILRVGRGVASSRVQAAGVVAGAGGTPAAQPPAAGAAIAGGDDGATAAAEDLPSDAEEFASPPPGSPPVQPSQRPTPAE